MNEPDDQVRQNDAKEEDTMLAFNKWVDEHRVEINIITESYFSMIETPKKYDVDIFVTAVIVSAMSRTLINSFYKDEKLMERFNQYTDMYYDILWNKANEEKERERKKLEAFQNMTAGMLGFPVFQVKKE